MERGNLRLGHIAFWAGDYRNAYEYYIEGARIAFLRGEKTIFKALIRYAYISLILSKTEGTPLEGLLSDIKSVEGKFKDDVISKLELTRGEDHEDLEKLINHIMHDVRRLELSKMKKIYKAEVVGKNLSYLAIANTFKKRYVEGHRFFNFLKIGDICIVRSFVKRPIKIDLKEVENRIKIAYPNSYVKLVSPIILESKIKDIIFVVRNDSSFEAEGSATDEFEIIVRDFCKKCIDTLLYY